MGGSCFLFEIGGRGYPRGWVVGALRGRDGVCRGGGGDISFWAKNSPPRKAGPKVGESMN